MVYIQLKVEKIMPKTRKENEQIVSDLAEKLERMKSVVFTSVSGYTMDDANMLREKGREAGVELSVMKKTLLVRALEKNGFKVSKDMLEGSILMSIGFDDEVAPARLMKEFSKDREEQIKILSGILEGELVDAQMVKQLAGLPSREELLAKVVGSINAPISGFVNVLAGNLRNIVYVLNAVKDKKSV